MLWRYAKIFFVVFTFWQVGAMAAGQRARWSIIAIVDEGARGAFLGEMTKFAEKEAFAIRTSQPRQDGKHFLVQLWREDLNMLILNPFDDPTEFNCAIYQTGTEAVPDTGVDELAKHFREEFGQIPGVTFKEDVRARWR
jgi:hypothetical protein